MTRDSLSLVLLLGLLCGQAKAQEGVAKSGMAQGEAVISVRSDVRMSMKGTRGTSKKHAEELGGVVTGTMPQVRKCYRDLVKSRPATVGGLELEIVLVKGKKDASLTVTERNGSDKALTGCVRRVLARMPLHTVSRPAAGIATLHFTNTRAAGQQAMNTLEAERARVQVVTDEGGVSSGSWATGDKKVGFQVVGDAKASPDSVRAVVLALKRSFASFLDCRRRADKDGLSPRGDTTAQLRLQRRGKGIVKMKDSTVAHKRGPICVERALKRVTYTDASARTRADVVVTFAD